MGEANDMTLGAVQAQLAEQGVRTVEMARARYAGGDEKYVCSVALVVPGKPGLTTLHAFGDTLGDALLDALNSARAAREEGVRHGG